MFGVVLWSNSTENKAVIWCEDQGELAYFEGEGASLHGGDMLDAGDLVQFELKEDRHLRYARNPRLIVQGGHGELPEALLSAANPRQVDPTSTPFNTAEIIPFDRGHTACAAEERVAV